MLTPKASSFRSWIKYSVLSKFISNSIISTYHFDVSFFVPVILVVFVSSILKLLNDSGIKHRVSESRLILFAFVSGILRKTVLFSQLW